MPRRRCRAGAAARPRASTSTPCSRRARRPAPGGGRRGVVFLANPNNPTGTLLDRAPRCAASSTRCPTDVLCVLDEAYAEYADAEPEGPALLREGREPLCVLRTFSQGLRAGRRCAWATRWRRRRWPTRSTACGRSSTSTSPAQEAALASLGRRAVARARRARPRRARAAARRARRQPGLDPVRSQANFVYADVPGGDGADGLADRLLREGFIVRALRGFGAPGAIRVTCGTDEENAAFAEALARVDRSARSGRLGLTAGRRTLAVMTAHRLVSPRPAPARQPRACAPRSTARARGAGLLPRRPAPARPPRLRAAHAVPARVPGRPGRLAARARQRAGGAHGPPERELRALADETGAARGALRGRRDAVRARARASAWARPGRARA